MGNIFEQSYVISNKLGLHARAASKFVQVASNYESEVYIEKAGQTVNGKSIMGLLILAAACGSEVVVSAEGGDAESAVKALGELIARKFDEEE